MKHAKIDWEYESECLAQRFYLFKYNTLDYCDTKNICEDEVVSYIGDDDDTMQNVRERIRYRIKHRIVHIPIWGRKEFQKRFAF